MQIVKVQAAHPVGEAFGSRSALAATLCRLSRSAALFVVASALAACSAMSARTHLERDGDRGDIEVVVTLDAGPPTLLYRRVILPFRLDAADAHRLAEALERTELTMMMRPAFQIRTQIEHAGDPLT